jgi:hypothetical protein
LLDYMRDCKLYAFQFACQLDSRESAVSGKRSPCVLGFRRYTNGGASMTRHLRNIGLIAVWLALSSLIQGKALPRSRD